MTENEKKLLNRFLNWLYDSGLEHLDTRFELMQALSIESVIDKFEKYVLANNAEKLLETWKGQEPIDIDIAMKLDVQPIAGGDQLLISNSETGEMYGALKAEVTVEAKFSPMELLDAVYRNIGPKKIEKNSADF